jgi:hypothetical protein
MPAKRNTIQPWDYTQATMIFSHFHRPQQLAPEIFRIFGAGNGKNLNPGDLLYP